LSGGLEEFSQRRMAKLIGISRIQLQRSILIAEIPEELFEQLLALKVRLSTKMLAAVGQAFRRGRKTTYAEHCPRCGHLLRVREDFPAEITDAINQWLAEQKKEGGVIFIEDGQQSLSGGPGVRLRR
jgi:hypothetical protein